MRLTPFKIGRLEGWNTAARSYEHFKGRQRADYLAGLRQGMIRHTLQLIFKEPDPVNTITDPGELTGS